MTPNRSLRRPFNPQDRPHRIAWALIAALLGAGAAEASPECPNAGNLFSNCGFETDDSGWDFSTGDSFLRVDTEAHSGTFSLEVDAAVGKSGGGALIEKCVEGGSPNTPYEYGFWFKIVGADLGLAGCQMSLRATAPGGFPCGGSYQGEVNLAFDGVVDGTFQTMRQEFFSNAGVDFEVGFYCSHVEDFFVYFDDLFIVFDSTVFADGFEARNGDTCEWSFASGGC